MIISYLKHRSSAVSTVITNIQLIRLKILEFSNVLASSEPLV